MISLLVMGYSCATPSEHTTEAPRYPTSHDIRVTSTSTPIDSINSSERASRVPEDEVNETEEGLFLYGKNINPTTPRSTADLSLILETHKFMARMATKYFRGYAVTQSDRHAWKALPDDAKIAWFIKYSQDYR